MSNTAKIKQTELSKKKNNKKKDSGMEMWFEVVAYKWFSYLSFVLEHPRSRINPIFTFHFPTFIGSFTHFLTHLCMSNLNHHFAVQRVQLHSIYLTHRTQRPLTLTYNQHKRTRLQLSLSQKSNLLACLLNDTVNDARVCTNIY